MLTQKLVEWGLAALLTFAPVEGRPAFPGWGETDEEALQRYQGIVEAAVAAVDEAPQKQGDFSKKDQVALLIALAIGETRLARDADLGPCYRGEGHKKRCDRGQSASVWQVWASAWGYEPHEIFADRRLAASLMLRGAKYALHKCRHLPANERLSGLSGRCIPKLEAAKSHYNRWMMIRAWQLPKPKEVSQ